MISESQTDDWSPPCETHVLRHRRAHLAVFPPVLILEFGGAALKLWGSGLQGVRPVVQLWQFLVSLQDFVHVHTHDVHHLLEEYAGQVEGE